MHLNKRGVALLQVLVVAALLAGMSAMILKAVTSRTLSARQTRQTVTAQMLIESCMKQVAEYWDKKFMENPARAIEILNGECRGGCFFEFTKEDGTIERSKEMICPVSYPPIGGAAPTIQVVARFVDDPLYDGVCEDEDKVNKCFLRYTIIDGRNLL